MDTGRDYQATSIISALGIGLRERRGGRQRSHIFKVWIIQVLAIMEGISVSRTAHAKIMLHLSHHPNDVIHGILIGSSNDDKKEIIVTDVLPICHSVPTKPLLDMAFRLADAAVVGDIVGWYSANTRIGDEDPSAVALKVIEMIDKMIQEDGSLKLSALLMVNNTKIGEGVDHPYDFYSASGNKVSSVKETIDHGNIDLRKAYVSRVPCWDFEDHIDSDANSEGTKNWITNVEAVGFAST